MKNPFRRFNCHKALLVGGTATVLVVAAVLTYLPRRYAISTDDAFVQNDSVAVVAKVGGYIQALSAEDNSHFSKGQLLAEIDPRDYEVALAGARSDVDVAAAAHSVALKLALEQTATIAESRAALAAGQASQAFAQKQAERFRQLVASGAGSTERAQQADSELLQRQAEVRRATAQLQAADSHAAVLAARSEEAQAALDKAKAALARAKLDLGYTHVRAAFDGTVANKTVVVGSYVQPGQKLLVAVPENNFVVANFKETEVARIVPGQAVQMSIDAIPGEILKGHVDSIQRGTGSNFALFPPENATGNFVKVVQRVPVKIVFDEDPSHLKSLAAGMTINPHVVVRDPPAWLEHWLFL